MKKAKRMKRGGEGRIDGEGPPLLVGSCFAWFRCRITAYGLHKTSRAILIFVSPNLLTYLTWLRYSASPSSAVSPILPPVPSPILPPILPLVPSPVPSSHPSVLGCALRVRTRAFASATCRYTGMCVLLGPIASLPPPSPPHTSNPDHPTTSFP
jgi:hypothetical protein